MNHKYWLNLTYIFSLGNGNVDPVSFSDDGTKIQYNYYIKHFSKVQGIYLQMMSSVPIMCTINRLIELRTTYDVYDAEIGESNQGISWMEFYLFF